MKVITGIFTALLFTTPTNAKNYYTANYNSTHQMVDRVAFRVGINPYLLHAIVKIESNYNCNAHNGDAVGIGQIKPATARSVGISNIHNCGSNLLASALYLKKMINLARGNLCAGLGGYQAGTPRCSLYGRRALHLIR